VGNWYSAGKLVSTALLALGLWGCNGSVAPEDLGESNPAGGDRLTSALSTAVRVKVAPAVFADIQQQAAVSGVAEAFRKSTVAAEVSGRVTSRLAEPGDRVTKGQKLILLDSERARIAKNEAAARLQSAEVNLAEARSELVRGENLHAREFISQGTLDTLRFAVQRAVSELAGANASLAAASRALNDTTIRAPFNGIAELIHVQEGDYLNPGLPVATVADFSRVRIRAGVTAREATLLAGTETASLTLEALGAQSLTGRVQSVARIADPGAGTYAVEIWLDDDRQLVREGMLATVYLPYASQEQRLTVPASAVFRRNGTMHAFVVTDDRAELRPVRTGRSDAAQVEVLEGLTEGETVVTEGQFALRDGAMVHIERRG
jgi:membrane fusion protein (multidrug efflux system)